MVHKVNKEVVKVLPRVRKCPHPTHGLAIARSKSIVRKVIEPGEEELPEKPRAVISQPGVFQNVAYLSWNAFVAHKARVANEESLKNSATFLYLFRALLREASYLPDQASRKFFHAHIVYRFRAHCPRKKTSTTTSTKENSTKTVLNSRLKEYVAEARKNVKLLIHANHGSTAHLQKILEMTYGRRGKRKHELLLDLMPEKPKPVDEKELQELAKAVEADRASAGSKEPRVTEKLLALIKSQKAQKDQMFTKTNLRSTKPVVPETNAWGRPFPKSRVTNVKKRWFRETLERLMPPLPEKEWRRLEDLALGRVRWEGRPERRAQALGGAEAGWKKYVAPSKDWHEITPRYMRRMWEGVFQQCPLMERDSTHSRWLVTWGRVHNEKDMAINATAAIDSGAFEGVNELGKIS